MNRSTRIMGAVVVLAVLTFAGALFVVEPMEALELAVWILGTVFGVSILAVPAAVLFIYTRNRKTGADTPLKPTLATACKPLLMFSILLILYMFIFSILISLFAHKIDYREMETEHAPGTGTLK